MHDRIVLPDFKSIDIDWFLSHLKLFCTFKCIKMLTYELSDYLMMMCSVRCVYRTLNTCKNHPMVVDDFYSTNSFIEHVTFCFHVFLIIQIPNSAKYVEYKMFSTWNSRTWDVVNILSLKKFSTLTLPKISKYYILSVA